MSPQLTAHQIHGIVRKTLRPQAGTPSPEGEIPQEEALPPCPPVLEEAPLPCPGEPETPVRTCTGCDVPKPLTTDHFPFRQGPRGSEGTFYRVCKICFVANHRAGMAKQTSRQPAKRKAQKDLIPDPPLPCPTAEDCHATREWRARLGRSISDVAFHASLSATKLEAFEAGDPEVLKPLEARRLRSTLGYLEERPETVRQPDLEKLRQRWQQEDGEYLRNRYAPNRRGGSLGLVDAR